MSDLSIMRNHENTMKRLLWILCTILLTGCTYERDFNLQEELQTALQSATKETILPTNMTKPMYAYTLPAHIGRNQSTQSATVLNDRNRQFIMNLNVSRILHKEADTLTQQDFKETVAQVSGEYVDTEEQTHQYDVDVYEQNGYYITVFDSDTVQFYAVSDALSACALSEDMLLIARSVKVNKEVVEETYAFKTTVNYESEKIELFEKIVPESGRIEELFEDSNSNQGEVEKNEDGPKQFTNEQDTSN